MKEEGISIGRGEQRKAKKWGRCDFDEVKQKPLTSQRKQNEKRQRARDFLINKKEAKDMLRNINVIEKREGRGQ